MLKLKTIIITVASVALVGFGINAFAHGPGWGGSWGAHGPNWGHRGGYGPWYNSQLTKNEYQQFDQNREAFLKETQQLRSDLFEKEGELQNELAKSTPDASKAAQLQKEISGLQAQIDQKRVDHLLEMKKINPNIGREYTDGDMYGGPMMGYGSMMANGPMMGYGPMMDYGSYGGSYCWE